MAALGGNRPNALFFAGDSGQRIFQQPFSWKSVGVDVRGRSTNLKVNYRTSHQIREHADRLLDREVQDSDGNVEDRRGTVSVFNGPSPDVRIAATERAQQQMVADWLLKLASEGFRQEDIAIFVRSSAQINRAENAAKLANMRCKRLEKRMEILPGILPIATMHLAKGLEFRAVAAMACDESVLPHAHRIETASDLPSSKIFTTLRDSCFMWRVQGREIDFSFPVRQMLQNSWMTFVNRDKRSGALRN